MTKTTTATKMMMKKKIKAANYTSKPIWTLTLANRYVHQGTTTEKKPRRVLFFCVVQWFFDTLHFDMKKNTQGSQGERTVPFFFCCSFEKLTKNTKINGVNENGELVRTFFFHFSVLVTSPSTLFFYLIPMEFFLFSLRKFISEKLKRRQFATFQSKKKKYWDRNFFIRLNEMAVCIFLSLGACACVCSF